MNQGHQDLREEEKPFSSLILSGFSFLYFNFLLRKERGKDSRLNPRGPLRDFEPTHFERENNFWFHPMVPNPLSFTSWLEAPDAVSSTLSHTSLTNFSPHSSLFLILSFSFSLSFLSSESSLKDLLLCKRTEEFLLESGTFLLSLHRPSSGTHHSQSVWVTLRSPERDSAQEIFCHENYPHDSRDEIINRI